MKAECTQHSDERYVLVDRDGVINEATRDGYVTSPEMVRLLPGSAEAIARLNRAGIRIIVVSNQQCVGKGLLSVSELDAISEEVRRQVRKRSGGEILEFLYCTHLAADECACRKPKAGLLLQARTKYGFDLSATVFIGDSYTDIETAHNAGCSAIFVLSGLDAWRYRNGDALPAPTAAVTDDLNSAVDWLLDTRKP